MKVSGALKDLLQNLHGDLKKAGLLTELGDKLGQISGYDLLTQQQAMSSQDQRDAFFNALRNQAKGLGDGYALGVAQKNPFVNAGEPLYPNKVIPYPGLREAFGHVPERICKVAEEFGFEYDFDTGSFIDKEGNQVTRNLIEGTEFKNVRKIFQKARTPNISWLDDRVNEMRVKLI